MRDYPNALASDNGWGGGSNKWEMLDGYRSVDGVWAHGLAFTGGRANYVEPAGPRQATTDFGKPCEFSQVVIWHHGNDHVPAQTALDCWNGSVW